MRAAVVVIGLVVAGCSAPAGPAHGHQGPQVTVQAGPVHREFGLKTSVISATNTSSAPIRAAYIECAFKSRAGDPVEVFTTLVQNLEPGQTGHGTAYANSPEAEAVDCRVARTR